MIRAHFFCLSGERSWKEHLKTFTKVSVRPIALNHFWFYLYQLRNLKQIHCAGFCMCVCVRVFWRHCFGTDANLHCPRGSCDRYRNWGCPSVTNAAGKQKPGKENRDPKRKTGFTRLRYKLPLTWGQNQSLLAAVSGIKPLCSANWRTAGTPCFPQTFTLVLWDSTVWQYNI